MTLLLVSFIAGILTVLAPCVLPLLPVILGGSLSGDKKRSASPYIIVVSLAVSVVLFTLILRVSTAFIDIPQAFWTGFSGGILIVFGFFMIFPDIWGKITQFASSIVRSKNTANKVLAVGAQKNSIAGDIIIGAALGPVFSSCSPTYFVILATVLPASFLQGLLYLSAYASGLAIVLLLVALLGRRIMKRATILANPNGWFKKILGILFVIIGIAVSTGLDKKIEANLIESGIYESVGSLEQRLLDKIEE